MAFAQVTEGVVVAISEGWMSSGSIPCGSAVQVGWLFDGTTFTPPKPTPIPTPVPTPVPEITPQVMAQQVLQQGFTLASNAFPSLNGTYSVSASSQANLNAVVTYVLLNGVFPGGASTYVWLDSSGEAHLFPTISEFKAFATVFADFVSSATMYGESGGKVGALPSNQITIA